MGIWGLIGGGLNMVSGIAGNNVQQESSIEGAERNAQIQRQNIAFQDKILEEQIERFEPYWERGKEGIQTLRDIDAQEELTPSQPTQKALSKTQNFLARQEGMRDQDFGPGVDERTRMNALISGKEADRSRALDYVDVGMGAAGSSGRLTPDQSGRLMSVGANLARGQDRYNTMRQNTISRAVDQASGLPAYMKYGQGSQNALSGGQRMTPEDYYSRQGNF